MFPYWVQVVMDCYYPLCSCLEDFVSIVAKKMATIPPKSIDVTILNKWLVPLAPKISPLPGFRVS